MKLLMPLSAKDFRHAFLLSQRFAKLGDMKEHSILVTACWADSADLPVFVEKIMKPLFAHAQYSILPDPYEGGTGTVAAGHMFYQSFVALAKGDNAEPICVMEADCFPVKMGWLHEIEEFYLSTNKPFSGAFNSTYDQKGNVIGMHMVGGACSIYPADLLTRCPELELLAETPYDIVIGDKVVPEALDMSESLIAHRWNTRSYKRGDDGLLIGKDSHPLKKHTYEIPVPSTCVLIHGCKDESLFKASA